jgi:hypothetical protein
MAEKYKIYITTSNGVGIAETKMSFKTEDDCITTLEYLLSSYPNMYQLGSLDYVYFVVEK